MIKSKKKKQQRQKAASTTKPSNGFLPYLEQKITHNHALLNLAANQLSDFISHYILYLLSFSHTGLIALP